MMPRAAVFSSLALAGLAAVSFVPGDASAGVLYRCEGPNGSIAYTNKSSGFQHCTVLQRYADTAPVHPLTKKHEAKPPEAAVAKAPKLALADPKPETGHWDYRENPPPAPPDVRAREFGVESTAVLIADAKAAIKPAAMVARAESPAALAPSKPRILRGAVYRVERGDGITEYTNVKPGNGRFAVLFTYIATCIACDLHSKIDFAHTPLNLDAFKDQIDAAAAASGVDVALLRAIIHAESAFNPMAVSAKGAQGLMQLMPGTAGDLGVSDAFDVGQNIAGGARYLAQLLKDFNGNVQLAAAAYNAGEGAVQKYGGVPPYDETKVYVQRVETLRDRYQKAL